MKLGDKGHSLLVDCRMISDHSIGKRLHFFVLRVFTDLSGINIDLIRGNSNGCIAECIISNDATLRWPRSSV